MERDFPSLPRYGAGKNQPSPRFCDFSLQARQPCRASAEPGGSQRKRIRGGAMKAGPCAGSAGRRGRRED